MGEGEEGASNYRGYPTIASLKKKGKPSLWSIFLFVFSFLFFCLSGNTAWID